MLVLQRLSHVHTRTTFCASFCRHSSFYVPEVWERETPYLYGA